MPIYNGTDEVLELFNGSAQVMALYNGTDSLLPTPYALHSVSELGYSSGSSGTLTPTTFRGFTISAIMWFGQFIITIPGAETPTLWSKFTLINSSGTVLLDQPVTAFTFGYNAGYNSWTFAMTPSPFPNAAADFKAYFHE